MVARAWLNSKTSRKCKSRAQKQSAGPRKVRLVTNNKPRGPIRIIHANYKTVQEWGNTIPLININAVINKYIE